MPPRRGPALRVATELVVELCCVGEVFSVAMLRGCAGVASHPLTRAVLTPIAEDERSQARGPATKERNAVKTSAWIKRCTAALAGCTSTGWRRS